MTFKTTLEGEILVRLQHIFAINEDSRLSQPVTVNLSKMISHLLPISISEMSITNNQLKDDIHRLHWNTLGVLEESDKFSTNSTSTENLQDYQIQLRPLEIRTFVVR